jgi:ABC-type transport system involved in multi-copper enzyme maturation permease subunit
MFEQIWTIARNTLTESIRQPVFLVVVVVNSLLMILGLLWSAYTIENDNKLLVDMDLSMMFIGGTILTAFTAAGVMSREIENRTVLTVVSKPITRPAFILGKFIGVAAAAALAFWIWALIFFLSLRHEVMVAASQSIDMPVVTFGGGAVLLAAIICLWGNYFYNWVFTSRFVVLSAVLMTLGYIMVLMIDKEWNFQSIAAEFGRTVGVMNKRSMLADIMLSTVMVFQGVVMLSAVALACSTRMGQVMTLVTCLMVWAFGMLSDWLFGRFLDAPNPFARIAAWIGYAIAPNFQFLWMADALAAERVIEIEYLLRVSAYSGLVTLAAICLAVALFQTRETG